MEVINITAGVYLIFNKDTGQLYPGGSINIERRIKQHVTSPNKGSYIDRAIQKHGWDRFGWVILEKTVPDWKIISPREKYWIDYYNALGDPFHYNLTKGGEGKSGYRKPYEDFEYTVTKAGKNGFEIYGRSHKIIKRCKYKSKLEPIATALNNGEITEEEIKAIDLNPFEYTVVKAGGHGFTICDRSHKMIKTCKDKSKLEPIATALNNGEITEEEVKTIDLNPFEYTVVKAGGGGFTIFDRSKKRIKTCKDKSKLEPIATALNNGEITEEEVKTIDLNPFEYTVVKAGKNGFEIKNRSQKIIKTCKDKSKLEPIATALNNGEITEEEVKSVRGTNKILKMLN